ncbi:MAG: hypothetical protein B9J98_08150 [Candidatus Terraquivivens tikiterensis]|uniref:DUF1874 domain-containing protein n=1 Tax=Candidatus Terraquivivens tikiterensis TaxID=1980982 RepID=A0A2R7Y0F0_9ARCH|nr:MAG: hypothetical protein B9J98_08150 [Candidatus Terraquivivens tikiterensis]
MARYLLSALITPFPPTENKATFEIERISLPTAKRWVEEGFVSAVGHESTASLLATLLGVEVPVNRVQVFLKPNDEALAVQFLVRLQEGQVLTLHQLVQLYDEGKIQFVLIRRLV